MGDGRVALIIDTAAVVRHIDREYPGAATQTAWRPPVERMLPVTA
jgi:chemotaxis protein histidine kinase CheA